MKDSTAARGTSRSTPTSNRKTRAVCPACGHRYESARAALACWLLQEPVLADSLSLQEIGGRLGVTRERARQIFVALGVQRRRSAHRPVTPLDPLTIVQTPVRTYRTDITPEQREKWRVYQRERYRTNPDVRAAVKRRYDERWAKDPEFREAHRRRARERYRRLKAQRLHSS
jgi:hypothetical protein